MINIVIPLNPVTKKNSQKIRRRRNGQQYISASDAFYEYQENAQQYLLIPPNLRGKFPIDYPVNVKEVFYMKDARRCDLTNLEEAIDDVLVHYHILKDDNYRIVQSHDGSRVYIDRENPRTEITITKGDINEWLKTKRSSSLSNGMVR